MVVKILRNNVVAVLSSKIVHVLCKLRISTIHPGYIGWSPEKFFKVYSRITINTS